MSAQNHDKSHANPPMVPMTESLQETPSVEAPVAPVIAVVAEQLPTASRSSIGLKLRFAPLMVLIATLPLGMGIGTAFRSSAPPSTKMAQNDEPKKESTEDISAKTLWLRRQEADDLVRAGEYELALQLYESKRSEESLRHSDHLTAQIALCREALGQWDEAKSDYCTLMSSEDRGLRYASLLGRARISLRRGELHAAQAALTALLGAANSDDVLLTSIIQESLYLYAMSVFLEDTSTESSSEGSLLIPPLHSTIWPRHPLTDYSHRDSEDGYSTDQTLKSATSVLCEAAERLQVETEQVRRYEIAEQLLTRLLSIHPSHPLAGQAKFALGFAAYRRGASEEAARCYHDLVGKCCSAPEAAAAYNRGIVQFQMREYRSAIGALGLVIDAALSRELTTAASILRGRALLELGEAEQAAFDFKRAARQCGTSEERLWPAVYTGMAYLNLDKPQLAAATLFEHRDCLQFGQARAAAAFLVSLARFESLETPDARDREALFLFRALSVLDGDEEWLGSCGKLLIGKAYQHLSQYEQMADVYSRALQQGIGEPFFSKMKFALAEHALRTGEVSAGLSQFSELSHNARNGWSTKAALRLAEWELSQGRARECLTICRELSTDAANRSALLALMGAAHEQLGEYGQASERYAGIAPQ